MVRRGVGLLVCWGDLVSTTVLLRVTVPVVSEKGALFIFLLNTSFFRNSQTFVLDRTKLLSGLAQIGLNWRFRGQREASHSWVTQICCPTLVRFILLLYYVIISFFMIKHHHLSIGLETADCAEDSATPLLGFPNLLSDLGKHLSLFSNLNNYVHVFFMDHYHHNLRLGSEQEIWQRTVRSHSWVTQICGPTLANIFHSILLWTFV